MKRLRVLVIMHEDLLPPETLKGIPPQEALKYQTEFDVLQGLRALGHEVTPLGLSDELLPLRKAVDEAKPHVVFNLLEEFADRTAYDQNVVSYLQLLGVPYTGCGPRGMILARDKGLSKKILHYHRIRAPQFHVFKKGRKVRASSRYRFPMIVKSLVEEASLGISEASVVSHESGLRERVMFVHESLETDAIAEEFIDGRELYVGVVGNDRLKTLPIWELTFENLREGAPKVATERVKWDLAFQKRHGLKWRAAAALTPELEQRIHRISKRIYRLLCVDGCGRIDFRLSEEGELFFLEANPNPDVGRGAELASAAAVAGLEYPQLLQRLLTLGMRRGTLP